MESNAAYISNHLLDELIKIREDLDYIKKVISEPEIKDVFLTKKEEMLVRETMDERKNGELLRFEDVFED